MPSKKQTPVKKAAVKKAAPKKVAAKKAAPKKTTPAKTAAPKKVAVGATGEKSENLRTVTNQQAPPEPAKPNIEVKSIDIDFETSKILKDTAAKYGHNSPEMKDAAEKVVSKIEEKEKSISQDGGREKLSKVLSDMVSKLINSEREIKNLKTKQFERFELLKTKDTTINKHIIKHTDEFSAICPVSKLPYIAKVTIEYYAVNGNALKDSGLLKYRLSFRNENLRREKIATEFFEDVTLALGHTVCKVTAEFKTVHNVNGICVEDGISNIK